MKYLTLVLVFISTIIFTGCTTKKDELPNDIKKLVDESNLPHAQVKFILKSIDSLQNDIKKTARLDSATVASPKK